MFSHEKSFDMRQGDRGICYLKAHLMRKASIRLSDIRLF